MFTGIIEDIGTVKSIEKKGDSGKITIGVSLDLASVSIGDSIAVDGACLSVVEKGGGSFSADMSAATLESTTLGRNKAGDRVNVERAMTMSKPLGGHMVSGHVDAVGSIVSVEKKSGYVDLWIKLKAEFMGQVVKKGSVAIDGASLTVADVNGDTVKITLIPLTLAKTTLGMKKSGDPVNFETDVVAKYVERQTSASKGVTEEYLAEHGFLKGKR